MDRYESGASRFEVREGRELLGFREAVRDAFHFLDESGYRMTDASPTLVSYEKGNQRIDVFHGRGSYVIGVDLHVTDEEEQYSLKELLLATRGSGSAPEIIAETREQVVDGVRAIAELVRTFPECLRGVFPVAEVAHYRRLLTDYYSRRTDEPPPS